MRIASLSGVLVGTVALMCAAAAEAQSGTPVQVIPITPVNQGQSSNPARPSNSGSAGSTGSTSRPPVPVTSPATVQSASEQMPLPPVVQSMTVAPAPSQTKASTTARKLDLAFKNGRVTLTAENVTVSEILAEWTKLGGTIIDNGEKLTGGFVSFAFENEPELNVLQALLRPYPGMIVAPRLPASTIASTFARVNIVPRSNASAASFVGVPASTQPPYPNTDDELPPVMAPGQMPAARMPQNTPAPPAAPAGQPSTSPSAGRPGAVVAPVTPTGSPTVPGQIIR